MAHEIYLKPAKMACPRCGNKNARVSIYHFGSTYYAECSECAFGTVHGCNEDMALARLYGNYLNGASLKKAAP